MYGPKPKILRIRRDGYNSLFQFDEIQCETIYHFSNHMDFSLSDTTVRYT